ncbi:uncharacterized protein G2W53_035703 [Senna tora]|uniref:Uncharacterized protein n=1 Tax=Senna tora TaxID=362788 RepID=A0A834SQX0_9FABA|nr:uncharacterized protein G2W53_035703 [Senna tora]
MYVTRPRSLYKKDPSALCVPPPGGPSSGYLVIQDEAANSNIKHMPFPQNTNLTVTYTVSTGQSTAVYEDKVLFIPVPNLPLSSNRYYVIRRKGKHQGEAGTSSTEDDMGTCCCCNYVKDVKPKPLDPYDAHQVFEIMRKHGGFHAKSVAEDGFPPEFLRRTGWTVSGNTRHHYSLDEALGLNSSLRSQLPDFNFPLSNARSESVTIGKWYVPFMFVKEDMKLSDQMKNSVFYRMKLMQRWEEVFSKENRNGEENNGVCVDVVIGKECVVVGGKEGVLGEGDGDGVLWFNGKGGEGKVGLSLAVYEQMKWEEERGGWVGGKEREVRLRREDKFEGSFGWKKYGCYVLVESFVLNRMDGSFVLSYDFRHTNQIRCKWE